MSPPSPTTHPTPITIVVSEACHWCEEAHRALEEFAQTYPVTIESIDARDEAGQRLLHAHAASMYPLVLVDGRYFSHGRMPRRRLGSLLSQRYAEPSAAV